MQHGGVDPGLLGGIQWWRTDVWYWSLEALAANLRAAADRTGRSVEAVRFRIATNAASPPAPT
jgi:hypothetical protein